MKLFFFKIKHLVSSFLAIMESGKIVNISLGMSCICILLGFTHNLSYVFKLRYKTFNESKMLFLTNGIFYMNFPNLLNFMNSYYLTLICFILLQMLIYVLVFHLFFAAFLKKQRMFKILRSRVIEILNSFFQIIVTLFYWGLLVPFLEFFANLADCDWYSYFPDYQKECPNNTTTIKVLSYFGLCMVFICGMFILWLYRTYIFLDKALLKKKFTLILVTIYLCKVLLVSLWPLIKASDVIVFIFLHLIGIFSLYDYLKNFPITNTYLSKFYISVLVGYQTLCVIFTLDRYTNIFAEEDLFYIIAICLILVIKIGLKLFENLYHRILIQNFSDFQFLGFSLEELHRLYQNRHDSNFDWLYFCGMLRFHIRTCNNKNCVLSEKKMQKFDKMNVSEREKLINRFISETFMGNIKEAYQKNLKNSKNFDSILLKYCSFLTSHNNNNIKSYYEIQHMLSLNTKKSFYFQSISLNLLRIIESLIKIYEYESKKNNENVLDDKEIDLQSFFEILKDKDYMKSQLIEIFIKKIDFWEQYKTGLHSYSQIIKNINKLMKPIKEYERLIELKIKQFKNSQKRIFALKFKIMFTSFIINTVNESIKVEDELEKLKKKELTLEKNIINCNSFFYGNVTTIHASFLKSDGIILESSKTIQMAKFFNYSIEEMKSMKSIENLMPEIIANNHKKFVRHFINKPRSKKDKEAIFTPTYALNKEGFIFPVKKYVGMNFDLKYDVVLHTAFLDLGQQHEKIALFDGKGNLQGTTEQFHSFFFNEKTKITKEHLKMMNLFSFLPDLELIVEKHKIFSDKSITNIINQSAFFYVPEDFTDILDVLTVKLKEDHESKSHRSFISYRSEKTQKSSNSQNLKNTQSSRFISKFFKTKTVQTKSIDEKQALEKKFNQAQKEYTTYDVLKELVDPAHSIKYYINFNIHIHHYTLSKSESLSLAVLIINKITKNSQQGANLSLKRIEEQKESYIDVSRQESIKFAPPSTFKDSEGVKSSFVQIPPENKTRFNDSPPMKEEKDLEINYKENEHKNMMHMMTTENEELIQSTQPNELHKHQNLFPPDHHDEKKTPLLGILGKNEIIAGYQTINSNNLSLNDKEKKNIKSENGSFNDRRTPSSAHQVKLKDVTSHHSSISNVKKTFSIFTIIKLIQKFLPPSLQQFSFCQFIELIIILSYLLTVYLMNTQYIDAYYNPLQNSISTMSQIYNAYAFSSLVSVRYELQKLGLASKTSGENAILYNQIFDLSYSESFKDMQSLVQEERSKATVFDYQSLLKTAQITVADLNQPILVNLNFLDFLDKCTEVLNTIVNVNFDSLQLNSLEYLPVNFIPFMNTYGEIIVKINDQFYSSNYQIIYTVEVIMVCLIIFCFLLKFFEVFAMLDFTKHIVRVINIFLRVNQNEAFNELLFCKEILQSLQDPTESYLNMLCTDKLLSRKMIKLNEEDINSNSKVSRKDNRVKKHRDPSKKNLKRFSFHNMKPLSNWPLYNYIILTFLILFLYIFFNYYYASILKSNIDGLITISIFFENLYTLPTTAIMINRIIVREKVITNVLYQDPNPEQREEMLYNDLTAKINELYNVSFSIPQYSLNSDILKSQTLSLIIYGDICDGLLLNQLITSEQKVLCDQTQNGAFQKGLLNTITQLINSLNDDNSTVAPIPFSDTQAIQEQIANIFALFKTNTAIDRIMTEFFFNKALMIFNNNIQSYYGGIMLGEMNNLKIVVLTTGILLFLFFALMFYWAHSYLQKMYRNMTMVLNLIPYEKLNNDEQTLFLIKKYWRG